LRWIKQGMCLCVIFLRIERNRIMFIAAVREDSSTRVQAVFAEEAARWRAEGLRVAGLVEEPHALPDRSCSGGVLRDVTSSKRYPIYLDVIPEWVTCHIDAQGAQTACDAILSQITDCDVVMLSKFGKLETGQSGLAEAFRAAFAAGKPVLTAVSNKHAKAWRAFAPQAIEVLPNPVALRAWRDRVLAVSRVDVQTS
jgi:hypothetical protein